MAAQRVTESERVNGKCNIKTGDLYYEQLLFSRLKQKYLCQVNKKERNKNTPLGLDLFKVNDRNTIRNIEVCSNLTIKTLDR